MTSIADRARLRLRTRQLITACTACPLHVNARPNPVPFSGPLTPAYMVLGEAPGTTEQRRQRPFCGQAGRTMRRMMTHAGLDPDAALWANTVCCCPFGPPPAASQIACRPHLDAQLALAPDRPLLALGGVALNALFPDAGLLRLHGFALRFSDRDVIPIYHPAYLFRDPTVRPLMEEGLERFASLVAGLDADFFAGDRCSACKGRPHVATAWDQHRMPFCDTHKGEIRKAANRHKRLRKAQNQAAQTQMEMQ